MDVLEAGEKVEPEQPIDLEALKPGHDPNREICDYLPTHGQMLEEKQARSTAAR